MENKEQKQLRQKLIEECFIKLKKFQTSPKKDIRELCAQISFYLKESDKISSMKN